MEKRSWKIKINGVNCTSFAITMFYAHACYNLYQKDVTLLTTRAAKERESSRCRKDHQFVKGRFFWQSCWQETNWLHIKGLCGSFQACTTMKNQLPYSSISLLQVQSSPEAAFDKKLTTQASHSGHWLNIMVLESNIMVNIFLELKHSIEHKIEMNFKIWMVKSLDTQVRE